MNREPHKLSTLNICFSTSETVDSSYTQQRCQPQNSLIELKVKVTLLEITEDRIKHLDFSLEHPFI